MLSAATKTSTRRSPTTPRGRSPTKPSRTMSGTTMIMTSGAPSLGAKTVTRSELHLTASMPQHLKRPTQSTTKPEPTAAMALLAMVQPTAKAAGVPMVPLVMQALLTVPERLPMTMARTRPSGKEHPQREQPQSTRMTTMNMQSKVTARTTTLAGANPTTWSKHVPTTTKSTPDGSRPTTTSGVRITIS